MSRNGEADVTTAEAAPPKSIASLDVAAWVAYLHDLERIMRAEIPAERWPSVFHRTDTPAQAADKLSGYGAT
jgi:hypothetical protein